MPGDARTWEGIRARVAELGRAHVRAGVVGPPAHAPSAAPGFTNGELATLHEYGNEDRGGNIPERSFVRSTVRDPEIAAEFAALEARLVAAVIAGKMSRDRALGLLGAWMASKIQGRILGHEINPEDAPRTLAAKAPEDRPLVGHTGQLAGAVSWEIVK